MEKEAAVRDSEGERPNRELRGYQKWVFEIIACILALSPFYWTIFGVGSIMNQRAIFIMMTLILVFMSFKGRKKSPSKRISAVDLILILISVGVSIYAMVAYEGRIERFGLPNNWDMLFGFVLSIIGLELVRRVAGWTMVILSLFFCVYAYWGSHIPGILGHAGYSIESIVGQIFCGFEGHIERAATPDQQADVNARMGLAWERSGSIDKSIQAYAKALESARDASMKDGLKRKIDELSLRAKR